MHIRLNSKFSIRGMVNLTFVESPSFTCRKLQSLFSPPNQPGDQFQVGRSLKDINESITLGVSSSPSTMCQTRPCSSAEPRCKILSPYMRHKVGPQRLSDVLDGAGANMHPFVFQSLGLIANTCGGQNEISIDHTWRT